MQFKIGLCQMKVGKDKEFNLRQAGAMIREAVGREADLVALPEMFNCPYELKFFPDFAEAEDNGETIRTLGKIAQNNHCYIVGGSIPEREQNRIYNTSFVFNPEGRIIAKYRKVHLFDIHIPEGISFQESALLSPGDRMTSFSTEFGYFGLLICYDLRFPELFRLLLNEDISTVIIPAAFNMTTGPAHWETLFKARAIDNQIYTIGISPARDIGAEYVAFGHSIVVDPWGEILWQANDGEEIGIVTIDDQRIKSVREGLPLLEHRRLDLYQVDSMNLKK